jgi:hypothetical protein
MMVVEIEFLKDGERLLSEKQLSKKGFRSDEFFANWNPQLTVCKLIKGGRRLHHTLGDLGCNQQDHRHIHGAERLSRKINMTRFEFNVSRADQNQHPQID